MADRYGDFPAIYIKFPVSLLNRQVPARLQGNVLIHASGLFTG
ncbi:hypothetical protein [Hyphomonas neptunium]|nr:hypothetical protein [Hyphomonas neptunium]